MERIDFKNLVLSTDFNQLGPGLIKVNVHPQKDEGLPLNTTKTQYEAYRNNKTLVGIRGYLQHYQEIDPQGLWCMPLASGPAIEMFWHGVRCWLEHTETDEIPRRYI